LTNADTEIRAARLADLERIFAIYNVEVEHGIATFDVEPKWPGRDDRWLSDRERIHPVIVATIGGEVAGWASLSAWSPRGAYRRTAEVSVYVDRSLRGRGLGGRLLEALVERARELELGVLLARVALPNPASAAIHEAAGFRSFGVQRRCGEKLGRIIDVDLMDLHLDDD
jgi:L-amino acid N-acyltransferase YncA